MRFDGLPIEKPERLQVLWALTQLVDKVVVTESVDWDVLLFGRIAAASKSTADSVVIVIVEVG